MRVPAISLVLLLTLNQCANIVAPSGGDKDETPPVLLSSTPPNGSVFFKADEIYLEFDEYVSVQDPFSNVVVSPPLSKVPKMYQRKKGIVIEMPPDTLLEETTYTINFGESIQDLNEGNKLPEFRYVFSTGSFVDSMIIQGRLTTAEDGTPVKKQLVLLHADLSDTAFYKNLPQYFGRTDDNGNYRITNIKAGTYNLFALQDEDRTFTYTPVAEAAAFNDEPIVILEQDSSLTYDLRLFKENKKRPAVDALYSPYYGAAVIRPNSAVDSLVPRCNALGMYRPMGDSVWFYAADPKLDTAEFIFADRGANFDTMQVAFKPMPHDTLFRGLRYSHDLKGSPLYILPTQDLRFNFRYPLDSTISPGSIHVLEDTSLTEVEAKYQVSGRSLIISYPWAYGQRYRVMVDSGAVHSLYGRTNYSKTVNLETRAIEAYADFKLKVLVSDSVQGSYFMTILKSGGEVVGKYPLTPGANQVELLRILPGKFTLRFTEDRNKDLKWNTGNLETKTQPERVYDHKEQIELRSNWEIETEIDLYQIISQ